MDARVQHTAHWHFTQRVFVWLQIPPTLLDTGGEREGERDQKIEREVVEGGGAKEEDENEEGDNTA